MFGNEFALAVSLLVAPVGAQGGPQWLTIVEKTATGLVERRTIPVQFVPFIRSPAAP